MSSHSDRVRNWKRIKGDQTLRLEYDLDEVSTVFEVGGYKGKWVGEVFDRYKCNIYVFEPVKEFYEILQQEYGNNNKIHIFNFGLAEVNSRKDIFISNDASSASRKVGKPESVRFMDIKEFFDSYGIEEVDLMQINIEGGEYELLGKIIESGLVLRIKNIQVQFHSFVPFARIRMLLIQRKLKLTHRLTYQYKFIWENWKRL